MPNIIYQNIRILKENLGIEPINTGRQINLLGIVSDDIESLHAIVGIKGSCINLVSGLEFSFAEYRGQTQEYIPCLSTLDRIQSDHELFASLCRSTFFKQALETHPAIRQLREGVLVLDESIRAYPICVDLESIAQHYGLDTEYLDITNNFSVASFFATQRWNPKDKKFEPMRCVNEPGVIYKLHPLLSMDRVNVDEIAYTPVGWQPFPRPEQQRANAIRLRVGQCFTESMPVAKYYFQHSRKYSKRIYEEFEGGNKLMPDDKLADFAESLNSKTCFPQGTLDEAFAHYARRRQPQDTEEKRHLLMTKSGITADESNSSVKEWDFNQDAFDAEIQRVLGRLRFRRACYPAKANV